MGVLLSGIPVIVAQARRRGIDCNQASGGKVRVEDMQESYWQKRFNGARRVAPEAQAGNAQAAALQAAAEVQATPTPR